MASEHIDEKWVVHDTVDQGLWYKPNWSASNPQRKAQKDLVPKFLKIKRLDKLKCDSVFGVAMYGILYGIFIRECGLYKLK